MSAESRRCRGGAVREGWCARGTARGRGRPRAGGGASGLIQIKPWAPAGKPFRRSRRGSRSRERAAADAYLGPSGDPLILRGGDLRREETGEASAHGRVARRGRTPGRQQRGCCFPQRRAVSRTRRWGATARRARRAAHLDGVVILDQRVDGRDRHDGAPTVSSPGPSFSERRGLECAPTRTRLGPSHFPFDERFAWRRIWRVRKSERDII